MWVRTDDPRILGQRLLVPALQGWLQPRLQESLPVLLCGRHPDYRQLRLAAVDPKGHEHARDFFECSLRFRTKRLRPFTFNVQLSNRLRDMLRFPCAWQVLRKNVPQCIQSVVFRHKAKFSRYSCPATLLQKLPNQGCAFFEKAAVLRSERFALVAIDIDFTNDFSVYPDWHDDL
jgi:hypothetical protein